MKTFLSSTYIDLIEHRKKAIEALRRLGQEVEHMEIFGARPEEPLKACLAEIEACDIFIGIYAHRYGFLPPNSNVSITELEYNHAIKHKKQIFCFIVNEDYPWAPKMIEQHPTKSKLENFKQKISLATVHDNFSTPEELGFKIASCIGRYLAQTVHKNKQFSEVVTDETVTRILKVKVHRGYFMTSPALHYFINATNLSPRRALEITHVWYEDEHNHIPVAKTARPLPFRLEIDQSWETWI